MILSRIYMVNIQLLKGYKLSVINLFSSSFGLLPLHFLLESSKENGKRMKRNWMEKYFNLTTIEQQYRESMV